MASVECTFSNIQERRLIISVWDDRRSQTFQLVRDLCIQPKGARSIHASRVSIFIFQIGRGAYRALIYRILLTYVRYFPISGPGPINYEGPSVLFCKDRERGFVIARTTRNGALLAKVLKVSTRSPAIGSCPRRAILVS